MASIDTPAQKMNISQNNSNQLYKVEIQNQTFQPYSRGPHQSVNITKRTYDEDPWIGVETSEFGPLHCSQSIRSARVVSRDVHDVT